MILHKYLIQIRLCICLQSFIEHILHAKQLLCAQETETHILPLRDSEHPLCFLAFLGLAFLLISYLIYYEILTYPYK